MSTEISIVVPVYNVEKYLRECYVAALLEYAVKFALTGSGSPKKDRWRVSMRHYAGRCRRLFCR